MSNTFELILKSENRLDIFQKPLADVLEEFLSLQRSEQTKRTYRTALKSFFYTCRHRYLGDYATTPYSELAELVITYIHSFEKLDPHIPGKVLNPRTVNNRAYCLSSFFNFLMARYNYPKNPVAIFRNHKNPRKSNTESLSRLEVMDLMKTLKKDHQKNKAGFRNYLIAITLFVWALRRSEVAYLKWEDFDFSRSFVSVHQKGDTIKREPFDQHIGGLFLEYKEKYCEGFQYVFHPVKNNSTGIFDKPIQPGYILKMIQKTAFVIAPRKKITPHSLRKSAMEIALDNKEDYISIANMTGHSSIEMIKYYDTRDELKNNAAHQLNKII